MMDKGRLVWVGINSIMAMLIVFGITTIVVGTINGDYHCPVLYDNETDWVTCYLIRTDYCKDMGCERIYHPYEKSICDCRSD